MEAGDSVRSQQASERWTGHFGAHRLAQKVATVQAALCCCQRIKSTPYGLMMPFQSHRRRISLRRSDVFRSLRPLPALSADNAGGVESDSLSPNTFLQQFFPRALVQRGLLASPDRNVADWHIAACGRELKPVGRQEAHAHAPTRH